MLHTLAPSAVGRVLVRLFCAIALLGLCGAALPASAARAQQRTPSPYLIVRPMAWMTALASSYGPGLYGNPTACGQILTSTTIGVAHRTLPCGTRLKFLGKSGQVVAATVIDRGPYSGSRVFDITEATVKRMGYRDAYDFGVRNVSWDYN